jgi:sRNA-binding protein
VSAMPTSHPRIAVTADPELGDALARVRAVTGTNEADATLVRRLAMQGARVELDAGRDRRVAAEDLFASMDGGGFDLDLEAIDRLNEPATA